LALTVELFISKNFQIKRRWIYALFNSGDPDGMDVTLFGREPVTTLEYFPELSFPFRIPVIAQLQFLDKKSLHSNMAE
jgi:hypothetical protein